MRPVLAPDLDNVFEPGGRHQSGSDAFSLQQRIRGDCGTMHDLIGVPSACPPKSLENHRRGICRVRSDLECFDTSVIPRNDEVSECPACVDTDAHATP